MKILSTGDLMKIARKRWSKDFGEWFREVIFRSGTYDYRYPLKGIGVWPPYGMKIRRLVLNILRKELEDSGHEEALFPTLIPEECIKKESEHIAKFEEEIFWVTRGGQGELETRYALRPTSETAIMPMFKLWVTSYKDLPIRIYQIVSVFRCETKATQPMIRLREVTTFKEAHTAHATFEEAEQQVKTAINLYKKFFRKLGIPFIISKRPEWDKFAGAIYTIAFDTVLPDGKVLQIGTVHNLGQNFSKAFDVKYMDRNGEYKYVYTTSYGVSDRVIAALISIHGDDHGMVLPPEIAPIQAVIIPIIYRKEEKTPILEVVRKIEEMFNEKGFRVIVDLRDDMTPGEKFYYWELKGVPLRIEVGPRDIRQGMITIVRRDTLERKQVAFKSVIEEAVNILNDIRSGLSKRAEEWFSEQIVYVDTLAKAKKIIKVKGGIVVLPWCGEEECGLALENILEARMLGYDPDEQVEDQPCLNCGSTARYMARFAKTY